MFLYQFAHLAYVYLYNCTICFCIWYKWIASVVLSAGFQIKASEFRVHPPPPPRMPWSMYPVRALGSQSSRSTRGAGLRTDLVRYAQKVTVIRPRSRDRGGDPRGIIGVRCSSRNAASHLCPWCHGSSMWRHPSCESSHPPNSASCARRQREGTASCPKVYNGHACLAAGVHGLDVHTVVSVAFMLVDELWFDTLYLRLSIHLCFND